MMPLRRALGFEPCRYPEPAPDYPSACRYCGRPIRWVPESLGHRAGYWAHRPSSHGTIRAAERGSEPLATSNPPQRATKLPLSVPPLTTGDGASDDDSLGLRPQPTAPSTRTFPQPRSDLWTSSDYKRFHAKHTVEANGCWLWFGSPGGHGYGQFWLDKKRIGAHVASWMLAWGDVPDGHDVMHLCDVQLCVNPEHLRPGTRSENLSHAAAIGTLTSHKLDEDTVRAIRADRAAGDRLMVIARRYGITGACASYIVNRKTWAHVA